MRTILLATLLALLAPGTIHAQTTQPSDADVPTPAADDPGVIDVVVGEGDSPVEGGSFEFTATLWTGGYEGKPWGRGRPFVGVQALDSSLFTGLISLMRDMKVGGKRRGHLQAEELFGEKITKMGHAPANTELYFEVTLDKVYPDQPFVMEVVAEGSGEHAAAAGDTVKMHYTGWTDGFGGDRKFDSSRDRGSPFVFVLGAGQVIEGWERGVAGMKVGEKRHLSVPHHMAYGQNRQGQIEPYSRLFFEVELVGFVELGIEVVSEGTGEPAKPGDAIEVHYTGWTDGFDGQAKFDSSLDRGTPFGFPLGKGQVIKGWDQGVVGMKPGEVRRLTIPPELGYGGRAMDKIPANSTLYFEVKYLGLKGR